MPSVVRRWQAVPAQKFFCARKIALAVACGAFAPSSCAVIVPHEVTSVSFQLLPAARLFGGTSLKLWGVAGGVTVGAGQGFAAAEADGDTAGEAEEDGEAAGAVATAAPD